MTTDPIGRQCPSVIFRRYGSAACDQRPDHLDMHCQSATGITWTDEQATASREDDSA